MLKELSGIPIKDESIQWIDTPKEFKKEILKSISSAKKIIHISALYLEDDESGREILDALYTAKSKNLTLDIKIFVDYHRANRSLIGSKKKKNNASMYHEFNQNANNPIDILGVPIKTKEIMGVLHLKGFIIDDRVVYSGASINNVYLHYDKKYRLDRYHIIDSAELAKTMKLFLQNELSQSDVVIPLTEKNDRKKKLFKKKIFSFTKHISNVDYKYDGTSEGNRITPLLGLGRKKNKLNNLILAMLAEAKNDVIIYTPYFNPSYQLSRAISKYLKRGKVINIITGDKTASDFYCSSEKEMSKINALPYFYEQILRKFVKKNQLSINKGLLNIYLWKDANNSFHAKGLQIDYEYYLITGSNLNPRAWGLDIENGLLLHDKNGCWKKKFENEHENILKNTIKINSFQELPSLSGYPTMIKKVIHRVQRLGLSFLLKKFL